MMRDLSATGLLTAIGLLFFTTAAIHSVAGHSLQPVSAPRERTLGELGMSREAREASERAQRLAGSVSPREKARIELRAAQVAAAALPNDTALRSAYRKK